MDIRKIKKLIELIQETDITEIEVSDNEESIKLTRGSTIQQIQALPFINASQPAPVALPETENKPSIPVPNGHAIKAPMVGTVYLSPAPDAPRFVTVGQTVKQGATLCIIEAMKMFNSIEAEKSGTITACLVENAQPVEFGQPLFTIE